MSASGDKRGRVWISFILYYHTFILFIPEFLIFDPISIWHHPCLCCGGLSCALWHIELCPCPLFTRWQLHLSLPRCDYPKCLLILPNIPHGAKLNITNVYNLCIYDIWAIVITEKKGKKTVNINEATAPFQAWCFILCIYFIFGHAGSLLLCAGFL